MVVGIVKPIIERNANDRQVNKPRPAKRRRKNDGIINGWGNVVDDGTSGTGGGGGSCAGSGNIGACGASSSC